MPSAAKLSSLHLLFLLVLTMLIGNRQVMAQQVNPVSFDSSVVQHFNSCTLLLPAGETDDFLRLLQRIGDPTPVNVKIAFQIGDFEPCYLEAKTPVELHFPKSRFSFRVAPDDDEPQYRFILNKTGIGPVVWFSEIGQICMVVDEDWNYEISCKEIDY